MSAEALGEAWQPDVNGINGGLPLLAWESNEAGSEQYAVSFSVTPEGAEITVFTDAARTQVVAAEDGVYQLTSGVYYYTATAPHHLSVYGSFSVSSAPRTVTVELVAAAEVVFSVATPNAALEVLFGANVVEPTSAEDGGYTFALRDGASYCYTVTAPGYNGVTREFVAADGLELAVGLTPSEWGTGEGSFIWGSGNAGQPSAISTGGTYWLGAGATGVLTISTSQPVALVGTGVALSDVFHDLYIDYTVAGADLTLRDLSISNTAGGSDPLMTNMIDFMGAGNQLRFAGTSVLDQDTNATGYAMVHVNSSTSLVVGGVSDTDTLYFYKREQGAGIGGNGGASGSEGQAPEYNGAITITGGRLFMKSSKQGALIGSGADAKSTAFTPGPITIEGGELNLIAISRSAAIGGAAGSSGGATGTQVYLNGGTVTINVDYSGSAIGGGGSADGNDADGGVLHYGGGSLRVFIDENALGMWAGVTEPSVDDVAITAAKVDGMGQPVEMLAFDTTALDESSEYFEVSLDGETVYSGGLHRYKYVNENLYKDVQVTVNYTIDNWVALDDSKLYLYATPAAHSLVVNGQTFKVNWDTEAQSFTYSVVKPVGLPGSGDLDGDGAITAAEAVIVAQAVISGGAGLTPAQIAAADIDGDGILTMADAVKLVRKMIGML
ncbi:MAG: dockerin type I repeat-containing protein [Coriobacteriales bacterium]|nr:dockerin type I repeat-containing protein [Coriobacteriales bacterium]